MIESYIKISLSVLFLKSNKLFMTQSRAFEHFMNHKETLSIYLIRSTDMFPEIKIDK